MNEYNWKAMYSDRVNKKETGMHHMRKNNAGSFHTDSDIFHGSPKRSPLKLRALKWKCEPAELNKTQAYINKLESEVMLMEADIVELMGSIYRGNEKSDAFEQCFETYTSLDKLVNDLNRVRISLNHSATYYRNLKKIRENIMDSKKNIQIPGKALKQLK